MKLTAILCLAILSTPVFAKNTKRAPANDVSNEDCKLMNFGYGTLGASLEGLFVQNCNGAFKFTPVNPQAAKVFKESKNGMLYVEPQTVLGKNQQSFRKVESKSNIVQDGRTYSTVTVSKDGKALKRYGFEHHEKMVTGASMINTETGEKYYVDAEFCGETLVKMLEKFEKIGSQCQDFYAEIDKENLTLLERGKGLMGVAETGLTMNKAAMKANMARMNTFQTLSQMCGQYSFLAYPQQQKTIGIPGGLNSGMNATFGL